MDLVPEVTIQPGCSARIPVWLRFPHTVGSSHHYLSVYCLTLSLVCQPSLQVQSRRSELLSHSNIPGQQNLVSLTIMAKDLVTSMDSLTVTQVVLVSRDQLLINVQFSSSGCFVSRRETTSLAMQTVQVETVAVVWRDMPRLRQLPANVIIPGGRLHFSPLLASWTAGQPARCPPNTDYVKSYLTHNLSRRGNAPVLGQDLCMVMWMRGGTSPAIGQTVISEVFRVQEIFVFSTLGQGPVETAEVRLTVCWVVSSIKCLPVIVVHYNIHEVVVGGSVIRIAGHRAVESEGMMLGSPWLQEGKLQLPVTLSAVQLEEDASYLSQLPRVCDILEVEGNYTGVQIRMCLFCSSGDIELNPGPAGRYDDQIDNLN